MIGCHPWPTCVKNCTADIKEIFFDITMMMMMTMKTIMTMTLMVFAKGGKLENAQKNHRSKDKNQPQTRPIQDAWPWNQSQAAVAGGEHYNYNTLSIKAYMLITQPNYWLKNRHNLRCARWGRRGGYGWGSSPHSISGQFLSSFLQMLLFALSFKLTLMAMFHVF